MQAHIDIEKMLSPGAELKREKAGESWNPISRLIAGSRVTLQDKARFCLELSVMLQAGVSLHRALQVLAEQTDRKAVKDILLKLVGEVRKGNSFSNAMAAQPKMFDPLFVMSAEVGQESGKLPQVMSNLALYLEMINVLRRKFLQALTYPFLVLSVAAGVVLFLLLVIVPGFSEMFRSMATGAGGPMELPAATSFILSVSAALTDYGLYMVLAGALVFFSFRTLFMSPKFRLRVAGLAYTLPFAGKILMRNMVARFCRTLGTLLQAQVSLVRALEVTARIVTSEGIRGEVKKIISYVKQGKAVAEPILTSKFFPPMVSQMIAVGEETSELDTMLFKVAEYYEKEVDTAVDSLSNILEPVLILVIGSIVAVIVVSMYLPMFEMMNMVGGG